MQTPINEGFYCVCTKTYRLRTFTRGVCYDVLGTSHATLSSLYKSEHSPVRTQLFWISLKSIPLYISTHLIRHHVGSVPFQLTCRDDRNGGNPGLPGKVDLIIERIRGLVDTWHNGGAFISNHQHEVDAIYEELEWLKTMLTERLQSTLVYVSMLNH